LVTLHMPKGPTFTMATWSKMEAVFIQAVARSTVDCVVTFSDAVVVLLLHMQVAPSITMAKPIIPHHTRLIGRWQRR
jgi:hypothetical protein